ncbi:amino acid adenylation domain-containing protein [Clostridium saccharoperbutylacetonicum]
MKYELTHAQRRILNADSLYQNSSISNIGGICYVPGDVDFKTLGKAIAGVVKKNEIFQFEFKKDNGQVYQEQNEIKQNEIEFIDFNNDKSKFNKWSRQFFDESMSVSDKFLYKFALFKLDDKRKGYLAKCHHIISDGYSLATIGKQVGKIYDNLLNIRESEIITVPYSEYIKSERDYLQSEKFLRDKEFWNEEFSNLNEEFLFKETYDSRGNSYKYKISKDLIDKLHKLLSENNISRSTFFMSLLYLYIYKQTGEKDIVIGMPVYNRISKRMREAIGMFVSTVPVNFKINNELNFKDFIKELNGKLRSCYKHQSYPYNVLVNDLKLPAKGYDGLFKIVFNYYNDSFRYPMNNSEIQVEEITSKQVGVPLNLILKDFSESNLELEFQYRISEFSENEIKIMCKCINNMLEQLVDNIYICVKDLKLVDRTEEKVLLKDFNVTDFPYNKATTIKKLFEEQVEKTPNNIAVVYKNKKLTYKELNERANSLARFLIGKGVKAETVVGVMVDRSLEMLIGIIGILKAGGAYLPIDPEYPDDRIKYILKDSKTKILLTQDKLLKTINYFGEVISLDDSSVYEMENSNVNIKGSSNDLAYVIYTSGTTGKPKGVMVEQKSLVNLCIWHNEYYEVTEKDRATKYAGFGFDASVWEIFPYIIAGAALYIIDKTIMLDKFALNKYYEENQITISFLPTQMCEEFMNLENKYLRKLLTGADKLKVYKKQTYELVNNYGPTENAVVTTSFKVNKNYNNIPIGKPINNSKIYILGIDNGLMPIGVIGELCVSGDGIARGYINRDDLTKEKFVDNPFEKGSKMYRTGDLARWLPDGNIEYLGRIDNQIKIRGFRIEIGEIENQFLKIEGINEVVVIGKKDKNENTYLCAYVSMEKELEVAKLKEELAKELPDYMLPKYIIKIDRLPLTPNGKVDKKALPEIDISEIVNTEYKSPRNEIENALVEAWKEVLGIDKIGINDNYYELGGDSIKSIQIVSALHNSGIKLEIKDLMKYQTIEELSKRVKYNQVKVEQGIIEGEVYFSPIQKWFLDNKFANQNHFNQAFIFDIKNGIDEQILEQAFIEIMKHHDALRMSYVKKDNKINQINRNIEDIQNMFTLNIYNIENEENCEKEVEALSNKIQEGLSLEKGILVKLGVFKTNKGDHLLIAIHHMIIDGISWRILLEDLEKAYKSIKCGKQVVLPQKTTSYKAWVKKLYEYSNSKELLREKEYWSNLESVDIKELPKDFSKSKSIVGNSKNITISLSRGETERLLRKTNKAYNTDINDILLCSLGLAVKQWSKNDEILIGLEGHGREEIIEEVSINRTIGWFTSTCPVILDMKNSDDIGYSIKYTKETLRHIPNKGVGYGILKYLTNFENKKDISLKLNPEIGFNYLGEFGKSSDETLFKFSDLSSGKAISEQNEKINSIEINGFVIDGELKFIINYGIEEYKQETIEKLTELYRKKLLEIIEHCELMKEVERTPWDYGDKELKIEDLNKILSYKKEITKIHSLTPMQEGILYNSTIDSDSHAYFEQSVFTVTGLLDIEILNKAFNKLIEKYEVLRTTFLNENISKPKQVVLSKRELKIYYDDISDLAVDKEEYLEEFKNKDKDRGFDLKNDCLIRVSVIKTGKDIFKIIYSFHHIIMDGWCLGIIIKDVIDMYRLISKNKEVMFDETEEYSGYLEWLDKQDKEYQLNYWSNYLSEYEQEVSIPKFNTEVKEFINEEEEIIISEDLTYKLKKMAEMNAITLNSVIQTAWGILLQKYNDANDVVFGSVVSGRPSEINSIENIVGLFINTVPVRVKAEDNAEFIDIAKKMNEDFIEVNSHSYCSLAEIQALTSMKTNLINNIVAFENYPIDRDMLNSYISDESGIKIINDVEMFEQINYDFALLVIPGDNLTFKIKYNGNVYSKETIKQIINNLYTELNCVIGNHNIKLRDIDILSLDEKNKLLNEYNNTRMDIPNDATIIDLFEKQVEKTPNNIVAVYKEKKLTYRELNEKSNSLARILIKKGVNAETIVGIMVDRSLEMLIGIMGVLKAGGAYLPIDSEYPEDRIKYMLEDSKARILLTQNKLLKNINYEGETIDLEASNLYEKEKSNIRIVRKVNDLAYVIYTSGTTGKPKGVMVEQKALVNLCLWHNEYYQVTEIDRAAKYAGFGFDASVWEIFPYIISGAALYIVEKAIMLDKDELNKYYEKNQITIGFLPTQMCEEFINLKNKSLRKLLTGADKLNYYKEQTYELINNYGPTENAVVTTSFKVDKNYKNIPIGKPISNSKIYILGRNNSLMPIGATGELCVSGDGLARGYLNRVELTREKFVDNPFEEDTKMYRTGDLARWLPSGNIEYLGRIDNQVKIRGFRIEIGEIENQLLKSEGINGAVVIANGNDNLDKQLLAYVAAEKELEVASIKDQLLRELPVYMIPNHIIQMDKLPITQNGKVNRKALAELAVTQMSEREYEPPRNEIEEKLVAIWEDLLNVKKVGIDDNFYELGGHSLKGALLKSKIKENLNIEIPLNVLFAKLTIRELSECIDKGEYACEDYIVFNEQAKKTVVCFPPYMAYGFFYNGIAERVKDYKMYSYNFIYSENLIEDYVNRILSSSDAKKFVFFGWSAGGKLAVEIADKMNKMGYDVTDVVLLDTMPLNFNKTSADDNNSHKISKEREAQFAAENMAEVLERVSQDMPKYLEFIENDNEAEEKMTKYLEYYNSPSTVKDVASKLHLILIPNECREEGDLKNEEIHAGWKRISKDVITYKGFGKHEDMLNDENIDKNANVIFNIFEKIEF